MNELSVDAFLADAVSAVDGKLYALGAGWNRIIVPALPAKHDRIGVGLLVHLGSAPEPRQHRFAIRLETPEGTPLALGTGPTGPVTAIEGGFTAQGGDATIPFALQLDGLPLRTAGPHAIVVTLDGEDVKRLGFHVVLQSRDTGATERPSTGTAGYL